MKEVTPGTNSLNERYNNVFGACFLVNEKNFNFVRLDPSKFGAKAMTEYLKGAKRQLKVLSHVLRSTTSNTLDPLPTGLMVLSLTKLANSDLMSLPIYLHTFVSSSHLWRMYKTSKILCSVPSKA